MEIKDKVQFKLGSNSSNGTINKLACMNFSNEDREQFAQLIGYSVSGICDLDYVSDRVAFKGLKESKKISEGK